MALRNYNVNDNAVVASAAGLITAGYAVCTTPTNTGYVVASTANRAALTNGWISGIAIGVGVSGAAVPIVNSGHVDASYVGTIGGSGLYVNVQSDGSLVRASSATANTVGHYEDDGGVWVNLGLQAGGAVTGNATAIQGVSVTSASATRSWILAGDGTALRMRKATHHIRDYVTSASQLTGGADATPALDALVAAMAPGDCADLTGILRLDTPWRTIRHDTGNTKYDLHFTAEAGSTIATASLSATPMSNIFVNFDDYVGNAASITALGNGGSGQVMMTMTGLTGITTAMADELVGKAINVSNSTTSDNILRTHICSIPSDGSVIVYNPRASAAAPDYGLGGSLGDGKVCWRIERIGIEIMARECVFSNICFSPYTSTTVDALVSWNESPYAGAPVVSQLWFHNCWWGNVGTTQLCKSAVVLADDQVPRASHRNYAVNGAGIPQVFTPPNADFVLFSNCRMPGWVYPKRTGGVRHYSRAGQSEWIEFRDCSFNNQLYHYMVPTCTTTGSYLGHADFNDCYVGYAYDTCFILCTNAFATNISRCKGEMGPARLINDRSGARMQGLHIETCSFSFTGGASVHPSGEIITTNAEGPLTLEKTQITFNGDSNKCNVFHLNHNNNREAKVSISRCGMLGSLTVQGRRGKVTSGRRGPHRFAGTETLDVLVRDLSAASVTTTLTFSQANLTSANGYAVDMDRVHDHEVGRLIDTVTNARANGEPDDTGVTVYTEFTENPGAIQITGGTANTILGFSTSMFVSSAVVQICTDTHGWVQTSATSASDEVCLSFENNLGVIASSSNHIPLQSFRARHYGAVQAETNTYGTMKYGTVVHSAGGTTFTFDFSTAGLADELDTTYSYRASPVSVSAAVATSGLQITGAVKGTGGIDFTVAADPATGNVTWGIEVIR